MCSAVYQPVTIKFASDVWPSFVKVEDEKEIEDDTNVELQETIADES